MGCRSSCALGIALFLLQLLLLPSLLTPQIGSANFPFLPFEGNLRFLCVPCGLLPLGLFVQPGCNRRASKISTGFFLILKVLLTIAPRLWPELNFHWSVPLRISPLTGYSAHLQHSLFPLLSSHFWAGRKQFAFACNIKISSILLLRSLIPGRLLAKSNSWPLVHLQYAVIAEAGLFRMKLPLGTTEVLRQITAPLGLCAAVGQE